MRNGFLLKQYTVIACIFTVMLFWGGCGIRSEDEEGIEQEEEQEEIQEISKEEALAIAARELEKLQLPERTKATLEKVEVEVRRDGNTYIVTYPTDWPPGVMGADYHFQFIIDARTGEIIRRLKGS